MRVYRRYSISIVLLLLWLWCYPTCINSTTGENASPVRLIVSSHKGAGLFCELRKILSCLTHLHEQLESAYIDWTSPYFPYKDTFESTINGWDLFFEPITKPNSSQSESPLSIYRCDGSPPHEMHSDCSIQWQEYDNMLSYRIYLQSILNRYIRIKPFITQQVDEFYDKNMKNCLCIGIQIRHSRHVENRASFTEYNEAIQSIIAKEKGKLVKIFMASDSYEPISYFKKIYGDSLITFEAWRQSGNLDPVFDSANFKAGFKAGVGALVDCLLLAKCSYFIHINSNLANFVSLYNPTIHSIFLPKKRPFQPCRGLGKVWTNPYLFGEQ